MNELLRRVLFLPEQASTYAREVDWLHYVVIGTAMVGALVVFSVAFVFLVRFRRRGAVVPARPPMASLALEVGLITLVLTLFVSFWRVGFAQYLEMETPPDGALEVTVSAKQWMWKFAYPGGPASVGVLYVPVHRPVKLLLTSRDVIHSLFVPAFRMKKDVIPGRYTTAWFEANQVGRFPIRCAEFCGAEHSAMVAEVVVLEQEEFARWLAQPTIAIARDAVPSAPETGALVTQGLTAAARIGCLQCHTVDGRPHIGPTFLGLYGRERDLADGTRVRADEAYLTESMMDPLAKIAAGFDPVMPSFFGRLSPPDAAAIIELIKSLVPERRAPSLGDRAPEPAGRPP